MSDPLRVGIGGPVGAGKTTLVEALCLAKIRIVIHGTVFIQ